MRVQTTIYNQYGKPVSIEAEVTFRRGYFIDCPRNEREFLDPGCPDELDVNRCWVVRGKRVREIKATGSIEEALLKECRAYC